MSKKQDNRREAEALLKKVTAAYLEHEKDQANTHYDQDVIDITISPGESMFIALGLNLLIQSFDAEEYIKESIGTGITSEKRWSKVAEIMLLKDPGEKLSSHGSDEFCLYWGAIKAGMSTRKASEEVFKRFKFNSQEACDQWLKREITQRQKEKPKSVYDEIPKPSTGPRIE